METNEHETRSEEGPLLAQLSGNSELPEHYSRHFDLVSRITDKHQEFIEQLPLNLLNRWKALEERRGLTTQEKPVPYVPSWFAKAFPTSADLSPDKLGKLELANFFLYGYNILFDDVLDGADMQNRNDDLILANMHLNEAKRIFNLTVRDIKFKNDLDILLKEYHTAEKSIGVKRNRRNMGDQNEMMEDYKGMCSLPKASALALSYLHNNPSLGRRLIEGHEIASVGVTFIDDVMDLEDDLEKGSWTYPLEQIRRKTQIGKDRLFEEVKAIYQVSEECLMKGIEYLQKAREIFEGVGCESYASYLDYVSQGALMEIGPIRATPTDYKIKDIFHKIHQGMESKGLST